MVGGWATGFEKEAHHINTHTHTETVSLKGFAVNISETMHILKIAEPDRRH